MPELPEVETIRKQLTSILAGKVIQSINIHAPKSFFGDPTTIIEKRITKIERYGKMMVIRFESSDILAIHLKMTGQILYNLPNLPNLYTRVTLHIGDTGNVYFNDIRRFGWMKIMNDSSLQAVISTLGPDPLTMSCKMIQIILQTTSRPVKLVLMDQEKIAGVGNIYANDALFLAGIHPLRKATSLSQQETEALFECLQRVLNEGVKYKGASKTNFMDIYGKKGSAQDHFYVYDREGRPCPSGCGETIQRIVVGSRGTFLCLHCQR